MLDWRSMLKKMNSSLVLSKHKQSRDCLCFNKFVPAHCFLCWSYADVDGAWVNKLHHTRAVFRKKTDVFLRKWIPKSAGLLFKERLFFQKSSFRLHRSYRISFDRKLWRVRVGEQTLQQACSQEYPGSARCVQSFDDSLDSAIRITYRISLRSSSMWEPRHPSLKVVFHSVMSAAQASLFLRKRPR